MGAKFFPKKQPKKFKRDPETLEPLEPVQRKPKSAKKPRKKKDPFYNTYEWKVLRFEILKESGGRCACCGRSKLDVRDDGVSKVILTVDHIHSRKTHKHLELEKTNLQVLCSDCHESKSMEDYTDFRMVREAKDIDDIMSEIFG